MLFPKKNILEVVENEDGSSTLAIVEIIQTATPVEEIRKQLSEKHCKRIKWIRKGE